jgi:hypothetical protein
MYHHGPFTVRWLDGREETIQAGAVFEDDLGDLWRGHVRRGAVLLLDAGNVVRAHAYRQENLPQPGARVRHRRHPDLTGVVQGFEWKEPGKLAVLPLRVYWDQPDAALRLGWFSIYPSPESLEPIESLEAAG